MPPETFAIHGRFLRKIIKPGNNDGLTSRNLFQQPRQQEVGIERLANNPAWLAGPSMAERAPTRRIYFGHGGAIQTQSENDPLQPLVDLIVNAVDGDTNEGSAKIGYKPIKALGSRPGSRDLAFRARGSEPNSPRPSIHACFFLRPSGYKWGKFVAAAGFRLRDNLRLA
jgi:hypothetical protein